MIALANGCFDCFHYGHLQHLSEAFDIAERHSLPLWVALTTDLGVGKGEGRPVFPLHERIEILRSIKFVARAVVAESGLQALQLYRPKLYIKGADWQGKLQKESELLSTWNGEIKYTSAPLYSSTKILTGELLNERIRTARAG